jgi:hypothetical protein
VGVSLAGAAVGVCGGVVCCAAVERGKGFEEDGTVKVRVEAVVFCVQAPVVEAYGL